MAGQANVPSGSYKTATESWNGTNWTEVCNDLNTDRGPMLVALVLDFNNSCFSMIGGELHLGKQVAKQNYGMGQIGQNKMIYHSVARLALAGGSGAPSAALSFWWTRILHAASFAQTEEWTGAGAPVGAWSTGGMFKYC